MSPWVLIAITLQITNLLLIDYNLATEIYCKNPAGPVPTANLEKTVLSVALAFYDGASNGNRTRGGLRKASEM